MLMLSLLMPRIFMALARGDRAPIQQILARTPPLPAGCQWATFLRCHDELTLEMVTPAEREFMWNFYAPEPRMRLNLGIRRRLAPLLGNDRRRLELANSLLLTLPGSPEFSERFARHARCSSLRHGAVDRPRAGTPVAAG